MSFWTHVAAIARVDSFGKMDFEKEFGKEVFFDSDIETWKDAEKWRARPHEVSVQKFKKNSKSSAKEGGALA